MSKPAMRTWTATIETTTGCSRVTVNAAIDTATVADQRHGGSGSGVSAPSLANHHDEEILAG